MQKSKEDSFVIAKSDYKIEYKNKKRLNISGLSKKKGDEIFFDIEYTKEIKNFLITFGSILKMDSTKNEIKFYFRYIDDENYCLFSIRGGEYIKFSVMGKGELKIQTSYIKIADINIFSNNFNFIFMAFEELTTVLIDNVVILQIEHTPEVEGKIGIQFITLKDEELNLSLENFYISDDVLNLEPIVEMPKSPSAYFMQANDFYEQNRYELSLYYYKKGLLYGRGDDKIYNRVANLFFLIEEFRDAQKYYNEALLVEPSNITYKINLGRTLLRLNKDEEAAKLLEEGIEAGVNDLELFVDYGSLWIKNKKYEEGLKYLRLAENIEKDNFGVLYKIGKCLIDMNNLDQGNKYLYDASKVILKNDMVKASIILKYSLEKKCDADSLKLLVKILEKSGEFRDVYELIKQYQWEVEIDNELLDALINSEIELELYEKAFEEFGKYDQNDMVDKIRYLKAKVNCYVGNFDEAEKDADLLLKKDNLTDLSKNEIIYLKLLIMSKSGIHKDYKKVFDLSLKDEEYYDEILEEYGKILVDNNEYEKAIETFMNIKKDKDNKPELLYNIALAYSELKEYLLAKEHLLKAFRINESPQIVFLLANILIHTMEYKEALNILTTYYNTLPKDGSVDNLIGNIYLANNKIPEAQKYYYKALGIDKENEEYALNLAESFYRLKDYKNAFHITKQIVKKEKFDRAKTLHMKVKSHLFVTLSCSGCSNYWDISVDENSQKGQDFKNEQVADLPKDAPAGICHKCNLIYCKSCVKGLPEIDATCPRCGTTLKFDTPSLKIIGNKFLQSEKL